MADRSELPAALRDDEHIVWSERFERWGTYAQGDAIFVPLALATGPGVCDYYRERMTLARIGVSTNPAVVDGLRARELAAENASLRTEVARLQALLAASPLRVAPSEHDGSAA